MSVDLRTAATDYLAGRRARGHRLADHDWLIGSFLDGLERRGVTTITVTDALAFAQAPSGTQRRWHGVRLHVLRGLAAHVHTVDPASAQLIPDRLLMAPYDRRVPYLYSEAQIRQLINRTEILTPPVMASTMRTLIGLLSATGLRSGEAGALDVEDLRVSEQQLAVTGKNGRERRIPVHASTIDALVAYQQTRAAAAPSTTALLIGPKGKRLNMNYARAAFRAVVADCELTDRPGCGSPRLHDLRHTFAVNSLIDAHRDGVNVDARLAALATYLGHVDPTGTYWYLTASPELMAVVSARMTAHQYRRRP
jgi:integrase